MQNSPPPPPPEPPVSFWAALEFGLEFLVSMSVLLFCDHVFNKSLLPLDSCFVQNHFLKREIDHIHVHLDRETKLKLFPLWT